MKPIFRSLLWLMFAASVMLHVALPSPYAFSLQGPEGPVTDRDFASQYLLLSFGYTSCPYICPTILYEMARVLQMMKYPQRLQPIFVSIDPSNDTQSRLAQYVHYFDSRIIGLTADYDTLKKMTDTYGASFGYRFGDEEVYPPDLPPTHSVYHSTLVYLLSPQREMVDVFDYQMGYEEMARHIDAAIAAQSPPDTMTARKADNGLVSGSDSCPLPQGFNLYPGDEPALESMLGQVEDRPTLLNFWALWCAPCNEELPLLDKLAAKTSSLAVHVLNLGDKPQAIHQQFDRLKITHLDEARVADSDILSKFHDVGLPFSVLFLHGQPVASKNGVIRETQTLAQWAICAGKQDG